MRVRADFGGLARRGAYWTCIFIAVLTAGMGGKSSGAEVAWRKDYAAATREASRLQRPLLLQFTAPWCGHCHTMLKHTFTDPAIAARVNDAFIPVLLNADDQPELMARLGIDALPVTIVLSSDMRSMQKFVGYRSAADLDRILTTMAPRQAAAAAVAVRVAAPTNREVTPAKAQIEGESHDHSAIDSELAGSKADADEPIEVPFDEAEEEPSEPAPLPQFAFRGICLVSMLEERVIVDGKPEHRTTHRNTVVCFVSAEHKARFEKSPEKYWPMADGLCVVSEQDEDEELDGNPEIAAVYAKRLWFFADEARRKEFAADPKRFAPR